MAPPTSFIQCDLSNDQVERYGRQMVLRSWGPKSQARLCASRVLVIGAGGLGCPVALYLAGAGVGTLGIVDHDRVEKSNLHRQVAHRDDAVGAPKAQSLRDACLALNPSIDVIAHAARFDASNARALVADYDVLVDATDNVAARYLINDVGVQSGKPIVCGSALGLEGQLTVYGYPGSCCYRCVFPEPPPPAAVGDCNSSGVLAPVPAIIGTMQALEVMKLVAGVGEPLIGRWLLFDGTTMATRIVRLRKRNPDCPVCGDSPRITTLSSSATPSCSAMLRDDIEHISVDDFEQAQRDASCIVLDVRDSHQFAIVALRAARNVPIRKLESDAAIVAELVADGRTIYCICRRGFLSQKAAALLRRAGAQSVLSVRGGLAAWATSIDPRMPIY